MDRRTAAEENYRKKFEEFGLTERFTFLRREWSAGHDKRFWSRCKTCGAEFISYPEVFKGRQKHLLCPQCGTASDGENVWSRSLQCDQAMEFYQQGHSVSETAARFCVTISQVNAVVKARGITNGRDWREAGREANRARSEEASIRREAERIERIKRREKQDARRKEEADSCKRLAEEDRVKKQKERMIEKQRAEAEKAETLCRLLNDKSHTCSVCGELFSISEFMKSKELSLIPTSPKYCSKECERKNNNRKSKECKRRRGVRDGHSHRARKYGCEYDPSVTLKRLVKRDGLRCAICGGMCDWNDHSWSEYSGPMYPSIDHIIPMARGGGHVWSNVQVAHIICNSEKGANIGEAV